MKTKLKMYTIELDFVTYPKKNHLENAYAFKNPTYPRFTKHVFGTSYIKYLQNIGILLCSKKGLEQLMRHKILICLKGSE